MQVLSKATHAAFVSELSAKNAGYFVIKNELTIACLAYSTRERLEDSTELSARDVINGYPPMRRWPCPAICPPALFFGHFSGEGPFRPHRVLHSCPRPCLPLERFGRSDAARICYLISGLVIGRRHLFRGLGRPDQLIRPPRLRVFLGYL